MYVGRTHCVHNSSPGKILLYSLRCRMCLCVCVFAQIWFRRIVCVDAGAFSKILFLDLQWNEMKKKKNYYVLLNAVCYLCASTGVVRYLLFCTGAQFACDNIFLVRCRRRSRRGTRSFSHFVFFFFLSFFLHLLISCSNFDRLNVAWCVWPSCIYTLNESMMRPTSFCVQSAHIFYFFFSNHFGHLKPGWLLSLTIQRNTRKKKHFYNILLRFDCYFLSNRFDCRFATHTHFAIVYFPAKKVVPTNTQYASS